MRLNLLIREIRAACASISLGVASAGTGLLLIRCSALAGSGSRYLVNVIFGVP